MRRKSILAGMGWVVLTLAACVSPEEGRFEFAPERPAPTEHTPDSDRDRDPEPNPEPVTPRSHCAPTAGGPWWTEEGQPLSFTVRCGIRAVSNAARFELISPPEGAALDPRTGEFSWVPGLDQAAVYQLEFRDNSSGEVGWVKVGVADAFDHEDNEPLADPATYTEEYGLPVFHLSYDSISPTEYGPATLVYRGHLREIMAKVRGATSAEFPKRSFTLEFSDADEFEDPRVGFGNRDKLVLITSFNDLSYVRPRLAFELWRRMDPGNIPVNTFHAVVYVNGEYRGLYTASDHVDSDLMRRSGLNKQGNLYKAVHKDANFSLYHREGGRKSDLAAGFEKKAGLPKEGEPGDFDDLEELTRFVGSASDADFRAEIGQRIHLPDYENWWIFMTLVLGYDSVAKNAYHYHDPSGGPFRFVPWDLDATLGQAWDTRRSSPYEWTDFTGYNELFQRMLDEPSIAGPMLDRYRALLQGPMSKASVLSLLDQLTTEIRPAALRDERRWRRAHRSYGLWSDRDDFLNHEQEIQYLRGWIDRRWDTLLYDALP